MELEFRGENLRLIGLSKLKNSGVDVCMADVETRSPLLAVATFGAELCMCASS